MSAGVWQPWLDLGILNASGALPVAQGGTAATTASAARTSLGLKSAAIAALLGTVSQTGGVPNGDIFQSGIVPTTGEVYLKIADGTLIMISGAAAGSTVFGNSSNMTRTVTLPASVPFTRVDFVAPVVRGALGSTKVVTTVGVVPGGTTSSQTLVVYSVAAFVAGDASAITLDALIIGRWFN